LHSSCRRNALSDRTHWRGTAIQYPFSSASFHPPCVHFLLFRKENGTERSAPFQVEGRDSPIVSRFQSWLGKIRKLPRDFRRRLGAGVWGAGVLAGLMFTPYARFA
jgi:hypothetical protein